MVVELAQRNPKLLTSQRCNARKRKGVGIVIVT